LIVDAVTDGERSCEHTHGIARPVHLIGNGGEFSLILYWVQEEVLAVSDEFVASEGQDRLTQVVLAFEDHKLAGENMIRLNVFEVDFDFLGEFRRVQIHIEW
jgi:hypothetical protein